MKSGFLVLDGATHPTWPPVKWREPFIQYFPDQAGTESQDSQVWTESGEGPYRTTLAYTPPSVSDPGYYRARFNGIFCDTIPVFWRNYPQTPHLMMTWFLPWLSPADQRKYLDIYVKIFGLTHLILSRPQAVNEGIFATLTATAKLCYEEYGLHVSMVLYGAPDEQTDEEVVAFMREVAPYVKRFITCWQADMHWDPLPLMEAHLLVKKTALELGVFFADMHWWRDAGAWFDAKDSPRNPNTWNVFAVYNRWTYAICMATPNAMSEIGVPYIDLICQAMGEEYRILAAKPILNASLMQYDTNAPVNTMQAAFGAVLHATPYAVNPLDTTCIVSGEVEAESQSQQSPFPPRPYWCGDLKGWTDNCTVYAQDGIHKYVYGYTDGGLRPDGSFL